jgi:UDP-N-acetylmuramyl tripeptide synthase
LTTFAWLARFGTDFDGLSPTQQAAFLGAVAHFVEDLRAGQEFRPGLRVKGIRGAAGIFEMTWADDGRATFEYGDSIVADEPHVVWRRVGTHTIFHRP